jgi:DnaJ-class molecular chaperone
MQIKQDYYQVLGVAPSASLEEIHEAYRQLAFQFHPDMNMMSLPNDKKIADQKMLEINEAYATLSDPVERRAYDIPMGYNTTLPRFKRGSKVRVNARASPFNGFIGVVDQEPFKGGSRFWYMVEIKANGLPSVARFAEEQLSGVDE